MMVGHEVSAAGEAVFLRDFDGNRLEAVCHPGLSRQLASRAESLKMLREGLETIDEQLSCSELTGFRV
jgi:hypothetical protein